MTGFGLLVHNDESQVGYAVRTFKGVSMVRTAYPTLDTVISWQPLILPATHLVNWFVIIRCGLVVDAEIVQRW